MSYNSRRRLMIAPSPSKYIDPNKSAIARILTHTHLVMATASTKSKSLRALFAMGWLFLGRTHIDHTFQFCSRKVPKISSVGCIHPAFFWNRIDRWLYDVVCILHIFCVASVWFPCLSVELIAPLRPLVIWRIGASLLALPANMKIGSSQIRCFLSLS